jgi:hypothetical protein
MADGLVVSLIVAVLTLAFSTWWTLLRLENMRLKNKKLTLEIAKLESVSKRREAIESGRRSLEEWARGSPEGSPVRRVFSLSVGLWDSEAAETGRAAKPGAELGEGAKWETALSIVSADNALRLAMSGDRAMSRLGVVHLGSLAEAGNDRAKQYLDVVSLRGQMEETGLAG